MLQITHSYHLTDNDLVSSSVYVKRTVSSEISLTLFGIIIAALANAGSLFAVATALPDSLTLSDATGGSIVGLIVSLAYVFGRDVIYKSLDKKTYMIFFVFAIALLTIPILFLTRDNTAAAIIALITDYLNAVGVETVLGDYIKSQSFSYTGPVMLYSAAVTTGFLYAVNIKRSAFLIILMTFPIPVILMLSGLFPSTAALTAMTAAALGAAAFGKSGRAYMGFFAAITAALLMLTVFFTIINGVAPYLEKNDVGGISRLVTYVTSGFGSAEAEPVRSYETGAIRHGELADVGDIKFTGNTLLEVSFPKPKGSLYLRGFIASDYYENRWYEETGSLKAREAEIAAAMSESSVSPLLLDGANINGFTDYDFRVRDLTENKEYIYLPYTMTVASGERFLSTDKTRFVYGGSEYGGQFKGGFDLDAYKRIFEFNKPLTDPARAADELLYREFVYESYLDVPREFDGGEIVDSPEYYGFVGEYEDREYDFGEEMSILSRKLYFIRNWLRENCEYDISVGKVPEGEDFVNYFLNETRQGSCSHFASAATLLCRSAGIPARYVEGYVLKPKDFPSGMPSGETASVNVTDTRAHAWVEVYIDDFGWYPYEFTSGYGNVRTTVTDIDAQTATTTAATTTAQPQASETGETSLPQSETAAPETVLPESARADKSESGSEREEIIDEKSGAPSPLWLLLLIIPAAIAAVPLRRNIILKKRAEKLHKLSPTAAVLRAWRIIGSVLRKKGLNPAALLVDYEGFLETLGERNLESAKKAAELAVSTAFAGYIPNELDKREALMFADEIKTDYYNSLSKKQQFYEKYFRVFL
jgi:hypothetical protein